jgi:hypothetical protein
MAQLDRKRPFATVFGEHLDHTYVQDEKKFDHAGNELGAKPEKAGAKPVLTLKGGKGEVDQVGAQLSE